MLLIVDDHAAMRESLELFFEVYGIVAESVSGPDAALERIARGDVLVVLQDMNFSSDTTSGHEGAALFRAIHAADPNIPVVLMTAWTSLEMAVALVKEGAADYIAKPWNDEKLLAGVRALLRVRELERENERLRVEAARDRAALAARADLRGLVYESQAMHRIVSLAVQVAPSDAPILIRGANGSGKEMLAEIVQANSRRRDRPFVRVNAGALPESLLEGELFGSEAGAFTGARARPGLFEAAHGGTLFLDEIATLPTSGQVKLLRVLQAGELQRLGSAVTRKVDVRVISATNANVEQAIERREFREDLYFRLNVVELVVPELRERVDDILPLARHFLAAGGRPAVLGATAERALLAHSWPGNVRELANRITRALLLGHEGREGPDGAISPAGLGLASGGAAPEVEREPARKLERADIETALARHGWNVSRAALDLGLSRQALYRRIEKLGIPVERRAKP